MGRISAWFLWDDTWLIYIRMEDRSTLLDFETQDFENKLLLENFDKLEHPTDGNYKTATPQPGFCIKTTNDKDEKVFINVCTCNEIPCPKNLTDEEYVKLLETAEPNGFRMPLSLGDPHVETDKSSKGCVAYDVAVNSMFYDEMSKRETLKRFFFIVAFDGLENKHNIHLKRDFLILKNRKSVGSLAPMNIRLQRKPWILEMDGDDNDICQGAGNGRINEVVNRGETPKYKIVREPAEGHPKLFVAEIQLPKVKVSSSLTLDIGEDRLVLATRSNVYHLDIFLPSDIDQDQCTAQFNRKTNALTVVMPTAEKS